MSFWLDQDEIERLDKARGSQSRAAFLKAAALKAIEEREG